MMIPVPAPTFWIRRREGTGRADRQQSGTGRADRWAATLSPQPSVVAGKLARLFVLWLAQRGKAGRVFSASRNVVHVGTGGGCAGNGAPCSRLGSAATSRLPRSP